MSRQFLAFNLRRLSLTIFPRTVPGASALAFSLLACAWALPRLPFAAPDAARAPAAASAPTAVANPFGAVLVDLRSRARSASAALARRAAPVSKSEPVSKSDPTEAARLVLSVPAIAPAPALRLSQNLPIDFPLPPRRSEELGSPASPTPPAQRLAEAAPENLPLPPRRSEELKAEAAPAAPSVPTADYVPPAPSALRLGENLPAPPRRPDELGSLTNLNPPAPPPVRLSAREAARQRRGARAAVAAAAPPADSRGFFEKLFGGAPQTSTAALGYAPAEGGVTTAARGIISNASPTRNYDQFTAVYDISAHTVYLPSGARLEAHSGLGARLDDPRYVHEKMRGPTPPTVYALTPREQLFHGVQALRLTPLGGNVFGRAGLLAHTFMLGPNGDSNGCVSFRNYQAFLQAYQNGEIRRLAVVASLN